MKQLLTMLILFVSFMTYAQQGINYKAIIKDGTGNIISNQDIDVQLDILKSNDSSIYSESHTVTTNDNGLIVLTIGDGTTINGNFFDIDWSNDLYKLQVAIDLDQDTNFEITEISEFKTVPYAYTALDKTWAKFGDNTYTTSEKVGIGVSNPTDLLHIENSDAASIKISNPEYFKSSSIKLESGDVSLQHTFFKIETLDGKLSFAVDSDFTPGSGYNEVFRLFSDGGISFNTGTTINEFSTDNDLFDNSNDAVPTERAVKTYVDFRDRFTTLNNAVYNKGFAFQDFVFGSTQLNFNGESNRFFFDKSKGAFRAGFANGNQWDSNKVGEYSTAFGFVTEATGDRSTALGSGTIASRFASTAIGNYNADDQNALFMVGNGSGSSNRNNAFVVKDNGDTVLDGELNTTTTGNVNMIPVAYGNVNANGTIAVGTGNFNITRNGGNYIISVDNVNLSFADVSVSITPMGFRIRKWITFTNGDLLVAFYDDEDNVLVDNQFTFFIYEP